MRSQGLTVAGANELHQLSQLNNIVTFPACEVCTMKQTNLGPTRDTLRPRAAAYIWAESWDTVHFDAALAVT